MEIIATIKDGFGNQLFMYACGYAAARRQSARLVLDATYLATSNLRNYELGALNIKYDKLIGIPKSWPYLYKVALRKLWHIRLILKTKLLKEKKAYKFDTALQKLKGSYRLLGYWQSEKYFNDYKNEILAMLKPNYPMSASFEALLSEIVCTESIAVHVRRGDYVASGICLDETYYKNAINLMRNKISNPTFYVFSDDMEYCKSLFGDKKADMRLISYETFNSTIEDFLLMKSCKHNIIANSSYSWWGAWANENPNKIVISPKRKDDDDFYPHEWINV